MKRGPRFFKIAVIGLLVVSAAILLFGFITMSLWNAILPAVIHVGTITFPQALGILVLCKILFSSFHGHRGGKWGGGHSRWKQQMGEGMKEKWMNMSQEEREKFRQNWRGRCGGWGRPSEEQKNTAE
jgi:Ca2+/H+ antiporter, TMEM165/GDT1 family